MDKIMDIAKKHNLKVIEDCAQSHGTKYRGKIVGNYGDISTFSFQASKTLTCGEGGCIITNSDPLAGKIYSLIDCGRTLEDSTAGYTFGTDCRLPEIAASLLLSQMKRFRDLHTVRNENGKYWEDRVGEHLSGIGIDINADRKEPKKWGIMQSFWLWMRVDTEGVEIKS